MPFHFASLRKDDVSIHDFVEADTPEEASKQLADLPASYAGYKVQAIHPMRDKLQPFLSGMRVNGKELPMTSVPLQKMHFIEGLLHENGERIIDNHMESLQPFVSAHTLVANHSEQEVEENSPMRQYAIERVLCGMRKRICETMDYPFYFVSGVNPQNKPVEMLVHARVEEEFHHAMRQKKRSGVEIQAIHRLSGPLQVVFAHTNAMIRQYKEEQEREHPIFDRRGMATITSTRQSFQNLAEVAHAEGHILFGKHPDIYTRRSWNGQEYNDAWEEVDEVQNRAKYVVLTAKHLRTLLVKLIRQGLRDMAEQG